MKRFKLCFLTLSASFLTLSAIRLAICTFFLSVFSAQPSDAVSVRNSQMIELGIIDEVKSPKDLGLEHLLQAQQKYIYLANSINLQRWQVVGYESRISGSSREIWGWDQNPQLVKQKNQYIWQATLRNQAIQNKSSISFEGEEFLQNKKVFEFVLQLSWCEPRIRKRNQPSKIFA